MEGGVPGGEPGVLPLVRQGHDLRQVDVLPSGVAGPGTPPGLRWGWLARIARQPDPHAVTVDLLRPQQTSKRPAGDPALRIGQPGGERLGIEVVRLGPPAGQNLLEAGPEQGAAGPVRPQSQPYPHGLPRADRVEPPPQGRLGADSPRVGGLPAVYDPLADAVLRVRCAVAGRPEQRDRVRVVVRDQQVGSAVRGQPVLAERVVVAADRGDPRQPQFLREHSVQPRMAVVASPVPGVAEPDLRQQVQPGGLGAAVGRLDDHEDVVGSGLGVADHHVEEPVVGKYPRVGELVLALGPATAAVDRPQLRVWELSVRVPVQRAHPGVGRCAVQHPPVLLDVLAVIALPVGQAEQPLLQDRIAPVRCCQRSQIPSRPSSPHR